MKIAIIGFGTQGRSAYEYFRQDEHEITVCDADKNLTLPDDVNKRLGPDHLKNLDKFDLIIRSPIIHPKSIVTANGPEIVEKISSVTNEFFKACPTKNIIGVTGTKGKGTTSTLISKILEADGKRVHLGGNIGTPPLELLKNNIQPSDWVVLELANFQLIDLGFSPRIAVCLMVTPEHLDWHTDMVEYITAKQQLFLRQDERTDVAIYYAHNANSQHIASVSPALKIPYMASPGADVIEGVVSIEGKNIIPASEIKLLGKHNWQNVCAAVTAAWQVTKNVEAIRSAITSFSGMEHRLSFIREFDGVKYYDDSFGTTPETAMVAIEAFDEPKIVILGGSDKGASFYDLAKTVQQNNVRGVICIGQTGQDIANALLTTGYSNIKYGGNAMEEIVDQARSLAEPGDVVLLSPGCASFGMFANYKDRAEKFIQAVQALS